MDFLNSINQNPYNYPRSPREDAPYEAVRDPPYCLRGKFVKLGPVGLPDFMVMCPQCATQFIKEGAEEGVSLERKGAFALHEPSEIALEKFTSIVGAAHIEKYSFNCPFQLIGPWWNCGGMLLWEHECQCPKRQNFSSGSEPVEAAQRPAEAALEQSNVLMAEFETDLDR